MLTTSLTSRPTASPVSPAPSLAAARPPTSRPHAVLGSRTAHGSAAAAHDASADANPLPPPRRRRRPAHPRPAPASRPACASGGSANATTWPAMSRPAPRLPRQLAVSSHGRARRRPRPERHARRVRPAPRARVLREHVERAALDEQADRFAHLFVDRALEHHVAHARCRGPAPRRRTCRCRPGPRDRPRGRRRSTCVMQPASTAARPSGSTLAGSVSRSAVETTAGSCTTRSL